MRTAVVTGASRGLGLAIVERLVKDSYRVFALSSSDSIHQAVERLATSSVHGLVCDVRDEQRVAAVVEEIFATSGTIEVLINNAGVGHFAELEEYTMEQYRHMFDVNVQGVFLMSKHIIPHMKRARDGVILNVASDVSRRTFPGGSLYVASKYAVQGLSGCLAQEARPYGVRVGTINPGLIDTYFAGSRQGAEGKEQFLQAHDLADLICYLLNAPKTVNFDEIVVHPLIQNYSLS